MLSGAYSSVVVVTDVTHPYIRVGDGVSLSIYLKYNLYNEPLMWVCLFDLINLSLQKSVMQYSNYDGKVFIEKPSIIQKITQVEISWQLPMLMN